MMNTTKHTRIAGSLMLVLGLSFSLGVTCSTAADKRPMVAKQKMSSPRSTQLDASSPKLQESLSNQGGGSGHGHPNKLGNFEIQDITSPRDSASGLPTGQSVTGGTIPVYSDRSVPNKLGNFEIQDITSPRDPASGLPTGQYREGGVNETTHIVSPRDPASGLPTGK